MKIKLKHVFIPSLLLANLLSSNVNATNLEDRVHHFEKLGWSIGVTVLETDNGEKESIHGDKRFHFNSTIKALACANILEKSDKNIISLDDSIKLKKGDIVTYSPVTKDYVGRNLTLKQACDATLT
ncbi:MAG: serine hydrolase, partial [Vibrio toranzoniae]